MGTWANAWTLSKRPKKNDQKWSKNLDVLKKHMLGWFYWLIQISDYYLIKEEQWKRNEIGQQSWSQQSWYRCYWSTWSWWWLRFNRDNRRWSEKIGDSQKGKQDRIFLGGTMKLFSRAFQNRPFIDVSVKLLTYVNHDYSRWLFHKVENGYVTKRASYYGINPDEFVAIQFPEFIDRSMSKSAEILKTNEASWAGN